MTCQAEALQDFEPIYFDSWRYVAVCKEGFWFVSDAWQYDYKRNERGSIVAYGRVAALESIAHLVKCFVHPPYYKFIADAHRFWEVYLRKDELIELYEEYKSEQPRIRI